MGNGAVFIDNMKRLVKSLKGRVTERFCELKVWQF